MAELKTVQEYIDETPEWADGTRVSSAPLTTMQWRIWLLATAGKFFEGWVVFVTGVALPLIVLEFQLGPAEKGMVGAATLFGILIGATALGSLGDYFGRKSMFIVEMILFTAFLILTALSPSFLLLVVCLFGIGLSLGCDYPTAHMVISESIPTRSRGRLVLGAFAFQAVGALVGTSVGYLILRIEPSLTDWRWMYASAVLPALLVVGGRFFIPQSGHWLVSKGRIQEAEDETRILLRRDPSYPKEIRLRNPHADAEAKGHHAPAKYSDLFFNKRRRRATILASVPWFLQDLGTYGIGIFAPTVLAATIGAGHPGEQSLDLVIQNGMLAAKGAALIDVLLIVGIVAAIFLADRYGRIRLQIFGFMGCALGLVVAALSIHFADPMRLFLIFAGFMIFNFMTNLGPNSMTYLLAGEVFPTHSRGMGAGFAASFAKIGAVMTAFLFPILLTEIGTGPVLYLLAGASVLGAWVTWRFRIETNGVNLERIGMD